MNYSHHRHLHAANLASFSVSSLAQYSDEASYYMDSPLKAYQILRRSTSLPNLSSYSHLESLLPRNLNKNSAPPDASLFSIGDVITRSEESDSVLLQEHEDTAFFRQLNYDFFRHFEQFHKCLPHDDDPLAGILNLDLGTACCLQKKLLVDIVKERRDRDKSIFTPFGRRLQEMAVNYSSNSLAVMTAALWRDDRSTVVDMTDYFLTSFQETDDDQVDWCFGECSVCLAPCRFVRKPPCCRKAICQICWQSYVRSTAKNSLALHIAGIYNLHCYYCAKLVPYSQALACTDNEDMDLIRPKMLGVTSATRCPICLEPSPVLVDKIDPNPKKQAAKLKKLRKQRGGHPHVCTRCGNAFCRFCSAEVHPKLSCQQLTVTEAGLKTWVDQSNASRPQFKNGRRCPNCKIPLSHNGGCPHMTCPACDAEFCYLCGRKYYKPLLGLQAFHTSSRILPVITCSKLWRSQPKRILVHSLVSFGIIASVVPLVVCLTPLVLTFLAVDRCRKQLRRS